MRANYTAKLWGIQVEIDPSKTERPLKVEVVGTMPSEERASVGIYVLPKDQRVSGGTKRTGLLYAGNQSTTLTVKKDDVVYILAVNTQPSGLTQTGDLSLMVKVSEAPAGRLALIKREASPPSILGNSATVAVSNNIRNLPYPIPSGWQVDQLAVWRCTWTEPPPELVLGQSWKGTLTLEEAGSSAGGAWTTSGALDLDINNLEYGEWEDLGNLTGRQPTTPPPKTETKTFTWPISVRAGVAPPYAMQIEMNCHANLWDGRSPNMPGYEGNFGSTATVRYTYELRQ